jgi:Fe-S-cluster containining protein
MGKVIDVTYRATESTYGQASKSMLEQQHICMNCGWCCQHDLFIVEDVERDLYIYYVRGHKLLWEPRVKRWFVLYDKPCKHYNGTCSIYERRPLRCADWMCPYPDGSIWDKMNIYVKATERILERKFGINDTSTSKRTNWQ